MNPSDAPPLSRRALRAKAEQERAAAANRANVDSTAVEPGPDTAAESPAAAETGEVDLETALGLKESAPSDRPAEPIAPPLTAPTPAATRTSEQPITRPPAPERRAAAPAPDAQDAVSAPAAVTPAATTPAPIEQPRRVALAWVDPDVIAGRRAPSDLTAASSSFVPVLPEILPTRRVKLRGILTPLLIVLLLVGGYTAATQLWSLDAVAPVVTADGTPAVTAPASEISWPDEGMAAAGVQGMGHTLASSDEIGPMASITKLVSALMVLEKAPLKLGEAGAEREITAADRSDFWAYLGRGESAVDVPVGGTLTQYELLQGSLIASAGNYTAMLTREYWPTDEEFAQAAREWLDENGLEKITVVEPTGIDRGNTADAASLIRLATLALADPVVAEIVATESAELPGVGTIENTNPLLGEDGTIGIKTGSLLGSYNLLAAREVTVGDTTAHLIAAVVGQPTQELRGPVTADVLDQLAAELAPIPLPAGTSVAKVTTAWGTEADVVTARDAAVVLWNTARVEADTTIELGEARNEGDQVGELRLRGPLDAASTSLTLTDDLGEPDAWWRLTHPLQLFGLAD